MEFKMTETYLKKGRTYLNCPHCSKVIRLDDLSALPFDYVCDHCNKDYVILVITKKDLKKLAEDENDE